jgi:DNA-binding NarL/FixJ family response regulator
VRLGTRKFLEKVISEFEYFEASNKEEAYNLLKKEINFDLIILDVNIPEFSCDQFIDICRVKSPGSKIMILSMNSELVMARRFYKLGVDAYVSKSSMDIDIENAFREVLNNKKYFSNELLKQLALDAFSAQKSYESPFEMLSAREFEIMGYLFQGKNVQEISQLLAIHQSSVSTYKTRIFEKLKVDNLIELYELFKTYNN